MTIAGLKSSQKATATSEVLATNDVRTLIAHQLGVDVKRVTEFTLLFLHALKLSFGSP